MPVTQSTCKHFPLPLLSSHSKTHSKEGWTRAKLLNKYQTFVERSCCVQYSCFLFFCENSLRLWKISQHPSDWQVSSFMGRKFSACLPIENCFSFFGEEGGKAQKWLKRMKMLSCLPIIGASRSSDVSKLWAINYNLFAGEQHKWGREFMTGENIWGQPTSVNSRPTHCCVKKIAFEEWV